MTGWELACALLDLAPSAAAYHPRHSTAADQAAVRVLGPGGAASVLLGEAAVHPQRAHQLAAAVSEVCWRDFGHEWRRQCSGTGPLVTDVVLHSGDRLPVTDFPLPPRAALDELGLVPTTRPSSRNLPWGETSHIRRFSPKPTAPVVRFDWSLEAPLARVLSKPWPTVAVCAPTRQLGAYRTQVPIHPIDLGSVLTELAAQLGQLVADGLPDVLVLPELIDTPDGDVAQVLARWAKDAEMLIVAGSAHVAQPDGSWHNIARVITSHGVTDAHTKHNPVAAELARGVVGGEAVRVFAAGTHRVAVVICLDLMTPPLADALAEAGVTLVLVPMMSRTTQPAITGALSLQGRAQPWTVAVNAPTLGWPGDPGVPDQPGTLVSVQPFDVPTSPQLRTMPGAYRIPLGNHPAP